MFRKKLKNKIINPDEIFFDSKNIPGFDEYQLEGRLEKPISKATFIGTILCFFILGGMLFGRVLYLQIVKGDFYFLRSENNYLRPVIIPPERGIIYDRNDRELAWNDYLNEDNNSKLVRTYTERIGLGHILGYIGFNSQGKIIGIDGIEKRYDNILGGTLGMKLIETDSKKDIKSESVERTAENGKNLKLTIDADLQSALHIILENVINDRGFGGGAGVVLDVNTGEVLAMVSFPEYNSQVLSRGGPKSIIDGYLNNSKKPFLNRAISGLYAPGSIIKPLMAIAALKEKIITPEKKIFSSGSISIPNPFSPEKPNVFNDWKAHGWVDMRRALAVSSNVYFYTIGGGFEDIRGLGINKINKYASLFGFGSETNIDLDKEEKGLIPSPTLKAFKNPSDPIWRIGDTYNASIGQGDFQITPIQAAVYVASIANEGKILQPHLVMKESEDKNFSIGKTLDIQQEYFKIIKEGMRMVVLQGTASGLNNGLVEIAAKTGTAELETTKSRFVNSWLIGFAPYEKPKIAFSILLERGAATNLIGGVFVGRQLIDWMIVHIPEYLTSS